MNRINFYIIVLLLLPLSGVGQNLLGLGLLRMADSMHKGNELPVHSVMGYDITKPIKKAKFKEIEALNLAISKNRDSADLYFQRGLLKKYLVIYDGAISDFDQALKLGSKNPEVLFYLSTTSMEANYRTIALAAIDKYSQKCPDSAKGFLYKGMIITYNPKSRLHSFKERCEESIPFFDKAIDLDPDFRNALIFRGYANQFLKHYDLAQTDYTRILKTNQRDALAYLLLGSLFEDKGDKEQACTNFKMAEQIDPELQGSSASRRCGK